MKKQNTKAYYDIAVIGAGSGGLTAAYTAVGFGKKVLLIDENLPGGECTWSGCIPSKALINEAQKIHAVREVMGTAPCDTEKAMKKVHEIIGDVYKHESPEALKADGIDFLRGRAVFSSADRLSVGDTAIQAKKYIISTGSSPYIPKIAGLKEAGYLDNETLFKKKSLPKSIAILGAGAIGVEMAQAMNRLGVKVNLIFLSKEILEKDEPEHACKIQKQLEVEGVILWPETETKEIKKEEKGVTVYFEKNGQREEIYVEEILMATGRVPNTKDMGLEAAGVIYDRKGIQVDKYMRTSQKNIYAVGDVAGPYMFSHMANVEGIQAIQNAVLPFNRAVKYNHVPWVTFSSPELAQTGMTEREAKKLYKDEVRIYTYEFNRLDRAITKGNTIESIKLVLNKKGKILGASVLADRAGEIIGEIQLLKALGKNVSCLSTVIHPYPTYGEVLNKLGKQVAVDNLLQNPIVRLFRKEK